MRRMTLTFRILTLVCATMLIFSIAGVSAVWLYTEGGPGEVSVEIPVTMNGEWTGSEILPDEKGYNHQWLIDNLINGDGIGLNSPNSTLNQNIASREEWRKDTIGSMGTLLGGSLDDIFGTEAANLEFLIEFIYDEDGNIESYNIYTIGIILEADEGVWGIAWKNPNIPYGQIIYPVYKTTVVKAADFGEDGVVWKAQESALGYAPSATYDATGIGSYASIPSINPDEWKSNIDEIKLGEISNPIWTHIGLENSVTLANATAYYAFYTPNRNVTVNITSPTENCDIKVYTNNDSNFANAQTALSGTPIATSTATTQADDSTLVTTGNISLTSGRYYYIAVSGNTEITFTINQVTN